MITTVLNHFKSGLHISAHVTLKCIQITFMEYKETNFHSCDFFISKTRVIAEVSSVNVSSVYASDLTGLTLSVHSAPMPYFVGVHLSLLEVCSKVFSIFSRFECHLFIL